MSLVGAAARAVVVLEQWLRFDPGLVNLVGEPGLGKRSVIKALCSEDVRPIRLKAPQQPDALLNVIARQLGVTPGAPGATIAAIREQSVQLRAAGYPVLVVIEQSDLLADASLALVGRLAEQQGEQSGLAVALLSQASLRERIRPLIPPQTVIQEVALVALSFDEANEYIDYLLTQGPWSGDAQAKLDRAAIFEASGGNPGQLALCIERHRAGLPISGPVPGRKRVLAVFSIACALAVVLSGVWVWQWYQPSASEPQPGLVSLERLERELANTPAVPQPLEPTPQVDAVQPPSSETNDDELAQALQAMMPVAEALDIAGFEQALADVAGIVNEPVGLSSLEALISPDAVEIPLTPLPSNAEVDEAPEIAETAPQWGFDEAVILSSASDSYTLQVFGTGNPDTARAQKAGRYATLALNIVKLQRDGKPWYVGLLGVFQSRATAQSFAREQQIDEGYWLRPLAGVQDQIREAAD